VNARAPVITGLGIIAASGCGPETVWSAIAAGTDGLKPLTLFPSPRYGQVPVGEVRLDLLQLGAPRNASRSDRLGWLAARDAIRSAGLLPENLGDQAGLILGCSVGGSFDSEQFLIKLMKEGRMRPRQTRFHECHAAVELIATGFGLFGPAFSIATACSSGSLAIATAAEMIQSGEADVMLAGGADSLARMTWGGFHSLLLVDPQGCRPFDATRGGMSFGEGAAMLVLESEESAQRRGAKILARLTGWGASCDAHHATAPHPEGAGAAAAMQGALNRAGLEATAIDYVNAHGTGTRDNDLAESKALKTVFGERVPPFSSTKRFFGHALAASGAMEAVICVEGLRRQQLLPNPGFSQLDEAIGLQPVTTLRSSKLTHVMSNSFGFGGNNAVLIFSTPDVTSRPRVSHPTPVNVTGLGVIAPEATPSIWKMEPPLAPDTTPVHACPPLDLATLTPNQRRRLGRMHQMSVLAARRAGATNSAQRIAIALGTGFGCLGEGAVFIENLIAKDEAEPMPARFPGSVHNAPAGQVAMDLNARGLNSAPTAGEITFECALWQAWRQLNNDEADIALAGAVDELQKYPLAIGKRWGLWNAQTIPGEGAMMAKLEVTSSNALARVTAIRLGRYHRPFDASREVNWIASAVKLDSIGILVSGAGGLPVLEPHYQSVATELAKRARHNIEHRTYKQECGEFHSASALGFSFAVNLARERQCRVLLYTLSARGGKALCLIQP
jgi:3-oxoacyl-(acyl-carrier-protein) synthase